MRLATLDVRLAAVLRRARATGELKLVGRALGEVPAAIFELADGLEGDEKFWECSECGTSQKTGVFFFFRAEYLVA